MLLIIQHGIYHQKVAVDHVNFKSLSIQFQAQINGQNWPPNNGNVHEKVKRFKISKSNTANQRNILKSILPIHYNLITENRSILKTVQIILH